MTINDIEKKCINAIRFLSIDMVQKANSGHPGAPMSLAPLSFVLWRDHLRFNPNKPKWSNRDKFILSAGHASALLYSILHLTGYKISINDIKNFRQYESITPGHPEYGLTDGVEATTGPLGQGFANGVGMAIALKRKESISEESNDNIIYSIVSDGDLMEGISSEAASIAGTLKLDNIIYFYDSNNISIEGSTDLAFKENVSQRFQSYGWNVIENIEGEDINKISKSIDLAKESDLPSIIILNTKIGHGSPNKSGTEKAHGEALGEGEVELTRKELNWTYDPFEIPDDVYKYFEDFVNKKISEYEDGHPSSINLLNSDFSKSLEELKSLTASENISTRDSSGIVLNKLSEDSNLFIGGSADLAGSTKTYINSSTSINSSDYSGVNMHYGVREHAMGGISNGLALSGFIPFAGTFLIFSDYMRNSIRLSALSELQVLYILTHDSIGLGEDGPTHQPISQLMSLRLIPNLLVFRPADYFETIKCFEESLKNTNKPSVFALTRQGVPTLTNNATSESNKGGYVLSGNPEETQDIILIGTGSEVQLCIEAQKELNKINITSRVVSMPCWELFEMQSDEYKNKVLPAGMKKRVSVEAGATLGWQKYIGDNGISIGIDEFGSSAPGNIVLEKKGFSVENILSACKKILER
ncbi:MAG: transketolase [Dehalococcoidia bacterium]|nr:transketolase [Dehalococcoidia bacterium]